MWKSHWDLAKDPFAEGGPAYVSLPSHDEAIARLVHAIESSERRAVLMASAGLGKTTVLHRAFNEARRPGRRFAFVNCPREGTLLVAVLAERLAERLGREPSRLAAWRALERAVRLATIQAIHVVIGIDNCESANTETRRDIESLANLAADNSARITVIQSGRPRQERPGDFDRPWTPAITLESLTRSQAEALLTTKLKSAGREEPVFTARAVTRLHSLSAGVPRRLEQLATLCLMAAAASELEVVPPELVDSVEQTQNDEVEKWGINDRRPTESTRAG
jgi:type II secretory pathway predicted ATPase ExeA